MYYFVSRAATIDDLIRLRIAHAFDGPPTVREVDSSIGPEGRSGTVFYGAPVHDLPRPIEWRATRNPELWVGWHAAARPGPHELRRPGMGNAGASLVRLGDGQQWMIPRVLACTKRGPRTDTLPEVYCVNDDGQAGTRTDQRYDTMVVVAQRLLTAWETGDWAATPGADNIDFCGALLGVCYRIGPEELLALELLTPENVELIILEAIDALERLKANAPDELRALVERADAEGWTAAALQVAGAWTREEEGATEDAEGKGKGLQ